MTTNRLFTSPFHRSCFITLSVFTLFSWICYVAFIEHPENLSAWSYFPLIFGYSFKIFAQLHVVLCLLVLGCQLKALQDWRWLKSMAAVFLISLSAEMGGTTIGIPFGHYEYTSLLGLKLFSHVPILIPLSWFAVSACGYAIAAHLYPQHRALRVLLTSLSLVLWDLSLDPAMSYRFSYWVWHTKGDYYYGMPLWNILGWFGTGLAIGLALDLLHFKKGLNGASLNSWIAHYSLFVSLGMGFVLLSGLWVAVLATGMSYSVLGLILWRQYSARNSRFRSPMEAKPA